MAFYLKKTRFFYGHRLIGLQLSSDGNAMSFRSKDQAVRFAESRSERPYTLEPREHSRPAYEVIELGVMPPQLLEFVRNPEKRAFLRKENEDA